MATGEARRFAYTPGQARPEPELLAEGDYQLNLTNMGKKGPAGWKISKPGKFPNRRITFTALGSEDNGGEEMKVTEFVSANPKALFRLYDIAFAAAYPEELSFDLPNKPSDAATRQVCDAIDAVLVYLMDNGIVLNVQVGHEEFNGRMNAKVVKWLPPGDLAEAEAASEETDEAVDDGSEDEAEEVEETPAPKRRAAAPAAKVTQPGQKQKPLFRAVPSAKPKARR